MKTKIPAADRLHPAPKPLTGKDATKAELAQLLQNMAYGAGMDIPSKTLASQRKSDLLKIVNNMASLVSRGALQSALGQSFYGKRDLYEVLGWKKELLFDDYRLMYERNGIAARVVDIKADECWRELPIIHDGKSTEDYKDDTKFLKAWLEIAEKQNLASVMHDVDVALGISRFAAIVIGVQGDDDYSKELQPGGTKVISFMRVLDEGQITLSDPVNDVTDPRYGLPKLYRCTFEEDGKSVPVHWTRVLHFKQGRSRSSVYGVPALQKSFNNLQDLEKVTGSSSEAFWQSIRRAIVLAANEGFNLPQQGTPEYTAMMEQVDNLEHQMSLVIRLRNMTATKLQADVVDGRNQHDLLIAQISGAEGIPQRILLGSERGELASSQDVMNLNNSMRARQKKTCAPWVRQLIQYLYTYGFMPMPDTGKFSIEWENLIEMTPMEKMGLASLAADVINKVTGNNFEQAMLIADFMAEHFDGYEIPEPEEVPEKETPEEIPEETTGEGGEKLAPTLSDEGKEPPMKA